MDWNDLRYFLAIAREGQMLGAARRMQVSQARLSRHLATLEEAVGARLFDRSTRGCTLTDDGRALLETAERIEAEMLSGLARLGGGQEEAAGTVRIGAPDGLGVHFLAPRLGAIIDQHPRLRVQLAPLPRNFSLSQREADIAIMIGRPAKGRLTARRLAEYSLRLYASRDLIAREGAPDSLEALRERRLIGYVEDLIHTPELNYAEEFLRDWPSSIEISSALGQLAAVKAGAGIGILHDFMAAGDPDLVALFPDQRAVREYWAAWHENLRGSRRVVATVEALARMMRAEGARFLPAS